MLTKTLSRLRGSFEHTPRTLALVYRSSPKTTLLLGGLTIAAAIVPLAVAYAGKAIVDAIVARSVPNTVRWVLVELGLVATLALLQRGLAFARAMLGARLSIDINVMILEKALTLELVHFEDPEFYDRLTRARREASSRPVAVVTETFGLFQNLLTLAGYALLLVRFSGWAVLALIAATIPATIAEIRFSNAAFRMRNWRSPDTRSVQYIEYVLANDEHAKEVKLFGIGPLLLGRYKALSEQFFREDRALTVKRTGWGYALSLLGTAAFYACYAAMGIAAAIGRLELGDLVLCVAAFRQGQQSFQAFLSGTGGMYEHNLYMSNLFDYLAIPTGHGETKPVDEEVSPSERGIRLDGVSFRYPGREQWAIDSVSLFIPRGECLALVGHNGAGKTTFIKLLTRLYEPTKGRILLDGKDLRSWDRAALHRRISVVLQDFNEYKFKVRENIGLGSVEHLEDVPRIERAVAHGGASELVSTLKEGLETQLGRWFKEGVELSGGQWQKIALARAFMREEADILILDEPTAALDAQAEHAVFERFRRLTEGRTSILISHRFPTVRMADRILVFDAGRIVEEGSHDELVRRSGRYAELFRLQAAGYL